MVGGKRKTERLILLAYSSIGNPNFCSVRPKLSSVSTDITQHVSELLEIILFFFNDIKQMHIKGEFSKAIWGESFW